jgi:hypothetical protein
LSRTALLCAAPALVALVACAPSVDAPGPFLDEICRELVVRKTPVAELAKHLGPDSPRDDAWGYSDGRHVSLAHPRFSRASIRPPFAGVVYDIMLMPRPAGRSASASSARRATTRRRSASCSTIPSISG